MDCWQTKSKREQRDTRKPLTLRVARLTAAKLPWTGAVVTQPPPQGGAFALTLPSCSLSLYTLWMSSRDAREPMAATTTPCRCDESESGAPTMSQTELATPSSETSILRTLRDKLLQRCASSRRQGAMTAQSPACLFHHASIAKPRMRVCVTSLGCEHVCHAQRRPVCPAAWYHPFCMRISRALCRNSYLVRSGTKS